jgi:hypothetical protein
VQIIRGLLAHECAVFETMEDLLSAASPMYSAKRYEQLFKKLSALSD